MRLPYHVVAQLKWLLENADGPQTQAAAAALSDELRDWVADPDAGTGVGDGLKALAETVVRGVVADGPLTPTNTGAAFDLDFVPEDLDQFLGRTLVFVTGTRTPGLRGQATDILSMATAGDPPQTVLTFSTLTRPPAAGDRVVII